MVERTKQTALIFAVCCSMVFTVLIIGNRIEFENFNIEFPNLSIEIFAF